MATAHLSAFLRRLTRGMVAETLVDQSDRQLVEQFLVRRDEAVFETLVRRHGPMVHRVCWRVLQQEQDAEDAFQATFLVLAQKVHTVRKQDSLASWLHGVAHRVAVKAKAHAAIRRRCEQQASMSQTVPPDEVTWRELRTVLDAELAALPEKWRLPLILCYLEGRTQDEAAGHLGWSRTTLQRRLTEARAALGRRLKQRGVIWPAALSAVLLSDCVASAALPSALVGSTVEAARCVAAGQSATPIVSIKVVALTEGALKAMLLNKVKIASAILLVMALLGGLGAGAAMLTPEAAATARTEKKADEPEKPLSPSRSLKGTYKFWSVSFGRDGKALATVTFDAGSDPGDARKSAVRLLDVQTGDVERTLAEDQAKGRSYSTIAGVGLSPDGKTVAAPASGKFEGEDGFSWLVLWDAETGKIRHKLKHPFFEVRALAFSRDSKLVATGTGINGAEQDFEAVKLWDVQTGKTLRTLKTRKWAVKVAFAPDSKLLAAVLTPDVAPDEVILWDPANGKSQTLPDSEGIEAIAFSPDGKVFLGASRTKLRRWDATTGKVIEGPDLKTGFSDEGWSAYAFSPDGKTLAISGKQEDKHLIALYDVKSAKRVKTLEGCKGPITSLSFTPDSNTLAAASIDETSYVQAIHLWDFDLATKSKK